MNFRFFSKRSGLVAALSGVLLLGMAACNKNNDDNNAPEIPVAGLMAFNLASDVPSAGVALSGNNAVNNLTYGSFTGGYLAVYTGDRPVETYNSASGSRLASGNFNFQDSSYYSLFIVGANNVYDNVIVKDDISDLTGTGKAFVRYINAIADSSSPSVTIASGGVNAVNETAAYKSVSGFDEVAAGEVAIGVSNGGTISANRTVTFEANKVYTVLLTGKPASSGTGNVEIKYISNGTVDEGGSAAKSTTARSAN